MRLILRRGFRLATAVSCLFVAVGAVSQAQARSYALPEGEENVVGTLSIVQTLHEDTFSDIALAWNQGYRELVSANPNVDPWLPGDGTQIVIPSRYVLPDAPHEGIVINVPEMRLYYYPKATPGQPAVVITNPISIGRQDWTTPHGVTKIVAKAKQPTWYPPESIREEHAEQGEPLPKAVPPGPDNPLGEFALRLAIKGYLIHGTNKPFGLGMRVTHGCIRMYPEDIDRLFHEVAIGTPVRIVNQPYKVGIKGDEIYLEVHPHLDEDQEIFQDEYSHVVDRIITATAGRRANINWNELQVAINERRGIPVVIGAVSDQAPATAAAAPVPQDSRTIDGIAASPAPKQKAP